MTQRQITHPAGQLPRCTCSREPRHFLDLRGAGKGGGHLFECNVCDRSTGKHTTFDRALGEWIRLTAVPTDATLPARQNLRSAGGRP